MRLRPAPHAVPRSALTTCEIMTGAILAHSWAGGALPALPWLLGVTSLVFGATLLIIRGQASLRWMVPGLGAAQLLLHGLLSDLPTGHAHGHGHTSSAAILDLSWQMLAAHAASAVFTAVVWHLRRRLLEAIIHWSQPLRALVAVRHKIVRPIGYPWVPNSRRWLLGAPRRGPPAALRCA